MPDINAPRLIAVDLTDTVDVSSGTGDLVVTLQAADDFGIGRAYITFESSLPTVNSLITTQLNFNNWTDTSFTGRFSLNNLRGDREYKISQIVVTDDAGNSSVYSASDLQTLGFDSSFSVVEDQANILVVVQAYFWKSHTLISGVKLGLESQSTQSDAAGYASLEAPRNLPFNLTAQKSSGEAEQSAIDAQVNLNDAISILKMIAGQPVNTTPVSRFQSLAADFDGSGTVSLADALGVLRHAVGLQAPKPSWVFVEEGDDALPSILNPGVPGPVTVDATPPGPIEVNLIGVLRGDVDGSYGVYGG